jgi:hypothetical protein
MPGGGLPRLPLQRVLLFFGHLPPQLDGLMAIDGQSPMLAPTHYRHCQCEQGQKEDGCCENQKARQCLGCGLFAGKPCLNIVKDRQNPDNPYSLPNGGPSLLCSLDTAKHMDQSYKNDKSFLFTLSKTN